MPRPSDARDRNAVLSCLEILRRLHSDLSLTDICVLTLVAERPGVSLADVSSSLDISRETASRSLRTLAGPELKNALPPALGLIRLSTGPKTGRALKAHLTADGASVVELMNAYIETGVRI